MAQEHGFWIKNDEWISDEGDHFSVVYADPERFGLTKEEIDGIFRRHNETIGSEGTARDTVLRRVTENGWVRVRRYNGIETRLVVQTTGVAATIPSLPSFITELRKHADLEGPATVVVSDYTDGTGRTIKIGADGEHGDVEGELESG